MDKKELVSLLLSNNFEEQDHEKLNISVYKGTIDGKNITITFDNTENFYDSVKVSGYESTLQTPTSLSISELKIKLSESTDDTSPNDSTMEGEKTAGTQNLMDTGDDVPSNPSDYSQTYASQSVMEIALDELLPIYLDDTAFEEFKNIIVVDIDDIKKLHRYICNACSYLTVDIKKSLNKVVSSFDSLNKLTQEKVQSEWNDRITMAKNQTYKINSSFNDIISNLKDKIAKNKKTDADNEGSTRDPKPVDEITPVEPTIPVDLDTLTKLTPAIAGAITFTEVVSMYTAIGSETVVKSSLTGNYGLLGLIHQNDKYYYKIIDKATGQVYFVEMNDKSKIEWDERGERKAVEIVGKEANILKLPQEGDVLVRNPEVGDVYFLNGDKMTFDGIDYYFISDNVTGEVGYIPVNTSLSEPVLVSELGSVTSDNVSEVK